MIFETNQGTDRVHLSQEAAILAMVHMSDGGSIRIHRVPDISDDAFMRLCRPKLPLGEHGTYLTPDHADLTTDLA